MTGHGDEVALREVLAGWLVAREGCTPVEAVAMHGEAAIVSACEREGVLSLIHARLSDPDFPHPVPQGLRQALEALARLLAARSLVCAFETRRIQHALTEANIDGIWLKGIALGRWLYPRVHVRDIADIDLLLQDHATTKRAAAVLAPLGYALPNPHIAGDLVVHELLAWSERTRLELDLHWDLSNDALFAGRLGWAELHAQAQLLSGLGEGAVGLSPVHALLHACTHRALNQLTGRENRLRWLYDIHLLWESLSDADKTRAVTLAAERQLADACLQALGASTALFGTRVESRHSSDLLAAASREPLRTGRLWNWTYFQWSTLRVLGGARKLRWLRQRLLPDLAHLRVRYGQDGRALPVLLWRRLMDSVSRWKSYHA